jgi:hypothetical protein
MSVNVAAKFKGIYYDDFPPSNPPISFADPNPSLAAGPNYLVETATASIAFIDKSTGNKLYEKSLRDFFAPLKPDGFVYNETVTYDELLGRFVVAITDNYFSNPFAGGGVNASYLDLAVSKTADPNAGWTFDQIDISQGTVAHGGTPKIGWNADALVVSLYMSDQQAFNKVIAFDSSTLTNSDPTKWKYNETTRQDPNLFVPATMHGSQHGDPMWFAESQGQAGTFSGWYAEVAVKMTNVLSSSPSFTSYDLMPETFFGPAPSAQQPGTSTPILVSSVIHNVSWRNNRLVTAWTWAVGGPNSRAAAIYWVEDDTSSGQPVPVLEGPVFGQAGASAYDPAIDIAPNMRLGLTFVESSPNQYMSMFVTGQTAASQSMQPPVGTHFGQTPYFAPPPGNPFAAPGPDVYAGICVDPVTGTFWAANIFKPPGLSSLSWGTGIANFSVS